MNRERNIKNDWRYQHQDRYLTNLEFEFMDYKSRSENGHDHCEFCGEKFSITIQNTLKKGWTDKSRYRWICNSCFQDFEVDLGLKRK